RQIASRIEWKKLLFLVGIGAMAVDAQHRMHFEIDGLSVVRNDVVFEGFLRNSYPIETLGKQIDRWRTIKKESIYSKSPRQDFVFTVKKQKYLEVRSRCPPHRRRQSTKREEREPFRKCKIFA